MAGGGVTAAGISGPGTLSNGTGPYFPGSLIYTGIDGTSYTFANGSSATVNYEAGQTYWLQSITAQTGEGLVYLQNTVNGAQVLTGISNTATTRTILLQPGPTGYTNYLYALDPVSLVGATTNTALPVVKYLVQGGQLVQVQHLRNRGDTNSYDITRYDYVTNPLGA